MHPREYSIGRCVRAFVVKWVQGRTPSGSVPDVDDANQFDITSAVVRGLKARFSPKVKRIPVVISKSLVRLPDSKVAGALPFSFLRR